VLWLHGSDLRKSFVVLVHVGYLKSYFDRLMSVPMSDNYEG